MIYWHIQMYLPYGRGELHIDSKLMLQEEVPVIGTGEWDDIQCHYFTGKHSQGLAIGDIILVREGAKIIAICKVTSESFESTELQEKYHNVHYRKVEVLDWYQGEHKFPQPQSTLQKLINKNTDSWKLINSYNQEVISHLMISQYINILKYKKQIILQEPPGTGKTRETKLIANEILGLGDLKKLKDSNQFRII